MTSSRDVLSPLHVSELRLFARQRVLLAFDYDGTLSPIAPTPEAALLPATTKQLLIRVAALYPVAVISGRALADIASRVADIGVQQVFGNHGLEWLGETSRPCPQVRQWVEPLHDQLAGMPGVIIEDKLHSLSVHFRLAPDHEQALQSILPVVRTLPEARVICGAAAVNLLPRDGANKGVALQRALAASGCDLALYVGDDDTDEDAFAALNGDVLLSIHIGASDDSGARYHLESQGEVDSLLQALIDARTDRRV